MNHFNGNFAKVFPERMELIRQNRLRQKAAEKALNPYNGLVEPVVKFSHHFEEGQRVRLSDKDGTLLRGKIETINRRGELNLLLDSGHHVLAHPDLDSVEPEDFPSAGSDDGPQETKISKQADAYNPYPLGDDVLAKRAPSGKFSLGDDVVDRTTGRRGKVTKIGQVLISVEFSPGQSMDALEECLRFA